MVKRAAIAALIGGVLGTLVDYIHVAYGVLVYRYPDDLGPLVGTSRWVPLEFALAGGLGYLVIRFLARRLGAAPISWKRLVFDFVLFVAGYFATGIFVEDRVVTGVILIGLSALGLFTRPRENFKLVMVVSGALAVMGPLAESVVSASGFFYYTYRDLWFVPSWLPFLWVLAAGVFVDGSLMLLRMETPKTKRAASEEATLL